MRECSVLGRRRTVPRKDSLSGGLVISLSYTESGITSDLQIRNAGILYVFHVAERVEIADRLPDEDRQAFIGESA